MDDRELSLTVMGINYPNDVIVSLAPLNTERNLLFRDSLKGRVHVETAACRRDQAH
jgi:hypothetical protein